ncbi:HNH endonuclease [Gordonia phage SpeedDemon]|nr:HNH endonuclease [Gordonia phage SpeedDemon]
MTYTKIPDGERQTAGEKYCPGCQEVLPASRFHKNKASADGLQYRCKGCRKGIDRAYYDRSPSKAASRTRWQKKNYWVNRMYIRGYLYLHPCVDCGMRDLRCLDFDHVRGVKEGNIARMLPSVKLDRLMAEIEKCEVRCANCHRIVTAVRAGRRLR